MIQPQNIQVLTTWKHKYRSYNEHGRSLTDNNEILPSAIAKPGI